VEDKKQLGLIVTAVTMLLCGFPGLCVLLFGVLTATDIGPFGFSVNYPMVGIAIICPAILMVLIPIGAGIYTFLQYQKEKESEIEDIGEIPPAI
jgi:hypothetical protein